MFYIPLILKYLPNTVYVPITPCTVVIPQYTQIHKLIYLLIIPNTYQPVDFYHVVLL